MENLKDINAEALLNDNRVVEEINRHLWIESEKLGYDIGFDKAKEDWLKNFSKAWMAYNMPDTLLKSKKKVEAVVPAVKQAQSEVVIAAPKKRRAKSYL